MKKLFLIALSTAAVLLTACNTGSFAYYDDIYSSSGDDQYKILQAKNYDNTASESAPITTMVIDEHDIPAFKPAKSFIEKMK